MNKLDIDKLYERIDKDNIPAHVGVIMDGNGRWAKKRFLPRTAGHREGMKRVMDLVENAADLNIKYLSLFAFSTENWKRPEDEVSNLMKLLVEYINTELDRIHRNNVKIQTMGDLSRFPKFVLDAVEKAVEKTKDNTKMILNIGLNYGGRDEIIRASKKIAEDYKMDKFDLEDLTEDRFKTYLYTDNLPDLDLLIRPSGELRVSNFMLYQLAYSEFWFSDVYWPDFKKKELYMAILDYQKRDRRFGGI